MKDYLGRAFLPSNLVIYVVAVYYYWFEERFVADAVAVKSDGRGGWLIQMVVW